ncbi:MAG: glycoside hydrolase family 15 protein, partial [Ardenticatenaceae bacterium]
MVEKYETNEPGTCRNPAPGGPGILPHWTRGDKDAVGTAYSTASLVWYTISEGIINEVYYPTIDRPQVRDLQYLITDGKRFFHEERRDLETEIEAISPHSLGVRITNSDPEGRYRLIKEIIADPYLSCVLMHTRLEGKPEFLSDLKVYLLCNCHLALGGRGDSAEALRMAGRTVLVAHERQLCLALSSSASFTRCSCGYVGVNDGWTDLAENFQLDYDYDCAKDGNVALTGEIALAEGPEWTVGLAFGQSIHSAISTLFQSLGVPFEVHRQHYIEQWQSAGPPHDELEKVAGDGGALYRRSESLLLAHEDKLYPGALIASLSIPWGQVKVAEEGTGGYHLVWTR